MATLKIKDKDGNWVTIQTLKGDPGEPGKDGTDYVLTEEDKQEIAELVLAAIPSSEEVAY